MLKDNRNKLIVASKKWLCFAPLKSCPVSDNEVSSIMTMCKGSLQQSHNIAKDSFSKINCKTKHVIDAFF